MKQYLLDTDVCIEILRHNEKVIEKVEAVGRKNCFVSEITIAELFYGAAKSGRQEQFQDVVYIQRFFEVVPQYSSLRQYGILKADLEAQGIMIGEFDLLIGACAVENHLVVVTSNVKHFSHIPNLKIEDWAKKSRKA